MSTPTRTCIGCRQRGPATTMARLALVDGAVVPWTMARPPGRGASLHPAEACVQKAIRSGAFARAFRSAVAAFEPEQLLEKIRLGLGPPT